MEFDRKTLLRDLQSVGYIADRQLATAIALMGKLDRPLLLEGEAGVGKTEVGKAVAQVTGRRLIRLQCYEGLDVTTAVYEWNYQRQLLAIKISEAEDLTAREREDNIFQEDYLLRRPLLEAIQSEDPVVLLIDEIDRADEEFEAYLLEVLSDYQITIPEIGTLTAKSMPLVFLTSNNTRELSDALRRRCIYHYVEYPSEDREVRILTARLPDLSHHLASQAARFVQALRKEDLRKKPGIAETLDWTAALIGFDVKDIGDDPDVIHETLMCLLKTREDLECMQPEVIDRLVEKVA
ncbi:MAG: MoxR family ATPase [Proteobacteria bacterium]|nr:MoxR family ATPase [Pseudomonadota bacterium]